MNRSAKLLKNEMVVSRNKWCMIDMKFFQCFLCFCFCELMTRRIVNKML